ncbi:hypothetical protein DFH27DRAFT_90199 [Peziza echinospora]|nr:hypothetical protein DFH27DRAFT_90199 [Peziza echinospora]
MGSKKADTKPKEARYNHTMQSAISRAPSPTSSMVCEPGTGPTAYREKGSLTIPKAHHIFGDQRQHYVPIRIPLPPLPPPPMPIMVPVLERISLADVEYYEHYKVQQGKPEKLSRHIPPAMYAEHVQVAPYYERSYSSGTFSQGDWIGSYEYTRHYQDDKHKSDYAKAPAALHTTRRTRYSSKASGDHEYEDVYAVEYGSSDPPKPVQPGQYLVESVRWKRG